MPHRLNKNLSTVPTIKELRGLIAASDAYDMDNVYLTEEGWIYRHYKKADKSVWWDEIITAGQVILPEAQGGPDTGEGDDNAPVIATVTADKNLGTTAEADITFETGDGKKDYEYGGNAPTPPSGPTLDSVTLTGNTSPTEGDTETYTAGKTGTADDVQYVLASDGNGDTVSGLDVTFSSTAGARTLTLTGTSAAASDSKSTTLSVDVQAIPTGGASAIAYDNRSTTKPNGNQVDMPTTATSGSGSGLTVSYTAQSGSVLNESIVNSGDGYKVGDTVAVDGDVLTFTITGIGAANFVTPSETGPKAINGYYPLYDLEASANAAGDGSSHSHEFDGTTYYMPNGVTFYHGNYGDSSY